MNMEIREIIPHHNFLKKRLAVWLFSIISTFGLVAVTFFSQPVMAASAPYTYNTPIGQVDLTYGWYNSSTGDGFGLAKLVDKHGFETGGMTALNDVMTNPQRYYLVETAAGNPDGYEFYGNVRSTITGQVLTLMVVVTINNEINTAYFPQLASPSKVPLWVNEGYFKYQG